MHTRHRIEKLREYMKKNNIGLSIVTFQENQYYLSGFKATVYTRPIIFMVDSESSKIVVPHLENEHVNSDAGQNIDEIILYYEKQQDAHKGIDPYEKVYEVLAKIPTSMKIGMEFNNITFGLAQSILAKGYEPADISKQIAWQRAFKDEEEIGFLHGASNLVQIAMSESLKAIRAGMTEMELERIGNNKMMEAAANYINCTVDSFAMTPSGIDRTIEPHVFSGTRKILERDLIIHTRKIALNGYYSELERSAFVGEPTPEQKKAFSVIRDAQHAAIEYIKPGVAAKDVDKAAKGVITKAGYEKYIVHRTGHGMGIGRHEEPYLRFDDEIVLENKMVFTIEPGIYIPGVGGFRHSDTLLLDNGGTLMLTEYPRDLKDLIF